MVRTLIVTAAEFVTYIGTILGFMLSLISLISSLKYLLEGNWSQAITSTSIAIPAVLVTILFALALRVLMRGERSAQS